MQCTTYHRITTKIPLLRATFVHSMTKCKLFTTFSKDKASFSNSVTIAAKQRETFETFELFHLCIHYINGQIFSRRNRRISQIIILYDFFLVSRLAFTGTFCEKAYACWTVFNSRFIRLQMMKMEGKYLE